MREGVRPLDGGARPLTSPLSPSPLSHARGQRFRKRSELTEAEKRRERVYGAKEREETLRHERGGGKNREERDRERERVSE